MKPINLASEIGEVLQSKTLPSDLAEAVDAIRSGELRGTPPGNVGRITTSSAMTATCSMLLIEVPRFAR